MKQLILVLITFFCFSSIKAQDNPYEIFGYESKVKYETNGLFLSYDANDLAFISHFPCNNVS
jgi:hypothetical protein